MTEDSKDNGNAIVSAVPYLIVYLSNEMSSPSLEISLGILHKRNMFSKGFLANVVATVFLHGKASVHPENM